jgi:hypothetical protein
MPIGTTGLCGCFALLNGYTAQLWDKQDGEHGDNCSLCRTMSYWHDASYVCVGEGQSIDVSFMSSMPKPKQPGIQEVTKGLVTQARVGTGRTGMRVLLSFGFRCVQYNQNTLGNRPNQMKATQCKANASNFKQLLAKDYNLGVNEVVMAREQTCHRHH